MDNKKFVEAYVNLQSNDCKRRAFLKRNNTGTLEMYIPDYGSIESIMRFMRLTYDSLAASIIDYEMHINNIQNGRQVKSFTSDMT